VTATAAPAAGLTLTELAVARGIGRERAWLLIEPFLAAGVVVEGVDGRLVVVDPDVAEAFEDWRASA
jgi:hypothetical protein